MNVTVTGAAGRLGSVVTRHLVQAGFAVRATDTHCRSDLPVALEVHNLLDREVPYRLLQGAQAVVHLANHPGVRGHDGQTCFNENVSMNMNVFEAARQCGVKHILFASSVQAFTGWRPANQPDTPSALPYLPMDGEMPANPGNPYALSKAASEVMLQYYARHHGLNCVTLRFPLLVDADWLPHLLKKEPVKEGRWPSNLDEAYTYLPMTEAARLVEAILRRPLPGYRAYFPTMPDPRVADPVPDLIGRFFPTVPLRRPREQMSSFVDLSRITADTGWSPTPLADLVAACH